MPDDARTNLQSNFKAIFSAWKARAPESRRSRIAFARDLGIGDGTLGRIQYGAGNTTLDVLMKLAEHAKVDAWQLLAPNMGEQYLGQKARDSVSDPAARRLIAAIESYASHSRIPQGIFVQLADLLAALIDQPQHADIKPSNFAKPTAEFAALTSWARGKKLAPQDITELMSIAAAIARREDGQGRSGKTGTD